MIDPTKRSVFTVDGKEEFEMVVKKTVHHCRLPYGHAFEHQCICGLTWLRLVPVELEGCYSSYDLELTEEHESEYEEEYPG
jgi:hypothetical protein